MPAYSQRHPSRDQRPAEWTPTPTGELHMRPGGYYKPDELASATSFWHSEGDPEEGHHMTRPSQGTLFDPEAHHAKVRQQLGEARMPGFDAFGDTHHETLANEIRNRALANSVIPTSHLQPRGNLEESRFVVEPGLKEKGTLGHYTGPPDWWRHDYVTVDPEGPRQSETAIHEMGHRHHLGTLESHDLAAQHPRGRFPDPLKEGVADAYVDRYGGPGSHQVQQMSRDIEGGFGKFHSYQHTGYSTHPEYAEGRGWDPGDRAVYAASRAHFSETGEIPGYAPRGRHVMEGQVSPESGLPTRAKGDPTIDATLHTLLSNSPHAVQALRQTGLKDVGAEAFRRHRDRQLLTQGQHIQLHLFDELRGMNTHKPQGYSPSEHTYGGSTPMRNINMHIEGLGRDIDAAEARSGESVWPHTMSYNQFGETPRKSRDVRESLGVARHHAEQMGFT